MQLHQKQRTDDAAAVAVTPHDMIVEATPVRNDQKTPQLRKRLEPSIIQATPVQKITKFQSFSNTAADAIVQDIPQQGQKQNIQSPFMRRNEEGDTTFKSPVAMQKVECSHHHWFIRPNQVIPLPFLSRLYIMHMPIQDYYHYERKKLEKKRVMTMKRMIRTKYSIQRKES